MSARARAVRTQLPGFLTSAGRASFQRNQVLQDVLGPALADELLSRLGGEWRQGSFLYQEPA